MRSAEEVERAATPDRRDSINWIAGVLLFLAAALIVVWQNSRLAVLWDLSYILENAHRIARGEIPYRDFPFPYAPLTFLIQAALIKLSGRVFWHTTAYCAVLNGLAMVLTWRILMNVIRDAGSKSRWPAILLTLPLIPLGIYSIFPHPFYDPDCTFAILLAVYLLQRGGVNLKHGPWWSSSLWPVLAGAALVVPLLVKQNTGLAFIVSAIPALVLLIGIEIVRRESSQRYLLMFGGAALAIGLGMLLITFTAGLKNYYHWTIQFAASRRTPARAEMLGIYSDKILLLWFVLVALGAVTLWLYRRFGKRMLALTSALLMGAPFVWPVIYLLRESDSSERADRLLNVWPVLLIFSFIVGVVKIKRRRGIAIVLPFILIATIHGAFMSQQLWGSTYAIWPLFMILLASTIADLDGSHSDAGLSPQSRVHPKQLKSFYWFQLPLTVLIAISLLISGSFYLKAHERLDYANLDDGELKRSSLPQLKGMSTRGDWIPNFEELIRYTNAEIPLDEGILILPGEDLFYFTTGRTPKFPVLLFDHTVNPYSPEEILNLARSRDIRWLIVKQEMQDEDEGIEKLRDELTEVLEQDFEQVESLSNYDIYHRRDPDAKDDDDDPN
jgi:hypothetical protein